MALNRWRGDAAAAAAKGNAFEEAQKRTFYEKETGPLTSIKWVGRQTKKSRESDRMRKSKRNKLEEMGEEYVLLEIIRDYCAK